MNYIAETSSFCGRIPDHHNGEVPEHSNGRVVADDLICEAALIIAPCIAVQTFL